MLAVISHFAFGSALLGAAKPLDFALSVGVVAIIFIAPLVALVGGLMQMRRTDALTEMSGEAGPEPGAETKVRRYQAAAGAVPPEVAALGEPNHVHSPLSLGQELTNLIGGLFGRPPAPPPSDKPTYLAFDDVLVAVFQGVYTVIPWDEITEWRHPLGFGISTGQKFMVGPDHKGYGILHDKLQRTIEDSVLPRAIAAIAAGEEITFRPFRPLAMWETAATWLSNPLNPDLLGPLRISAQSISYLGETLPWRDIGSLELIHYQRSGFALYTALLIGRRGGFLSLWRINLKSVPNDSVLLALLRRLAPKDVLVVADSPRGKTTGWF
jgi:hypothetical protein